MLDQLRNQLRDLLAQRADKQAALDATLAAPTAEARDLTAAEADLFTEARDAVAALDDAIAPLEARIGELETIEARRAAADAATTRLGAAAPVSAAAVVTSEPRTYTDHAARSGVSFFADLAARTENPAAADRLLRHQREEQVERRDVGTGAFAGLVVPQYLTDLVAPVARAGRPVADIATKHPLPAAGMTVNISRITTGTAVAVQSSENSAVQETDIDDTLLTIDVRTIAGAQDVSRQALDRGVGVDAIVLEDLQRAYNAKLDEQLISGSGSSGEHRGIRNVSNIVSVTYTDASPTVAELYPKVADLIQQVQSGVYAGVTHFVMHPRRWWWIASALSSTFPLVTMPGTAAQQAGNAGSSDYAGANRSLFGVPVVLDGNMPTNLGAGTDEDLILGVSANELHLWEDPTLQVRAEQTGAGSLTVKFVLFGYSAFTAGRYPGAHGKIGGTGLIAPTF